MTITILCVGRLKEKFYAQAVSEYTKRLSRYAKVEIIEVKDEPTPESPTERERKLVLDKDFQTTVPGLFAAGDCTGGTLQVAVAVGEGAIAGLAAIKYLREHRE